MTQVHETWEVVYSQTGDAVRRMKVPTGWLYQVAKFERSVELGDKGHNTPTDTVGFYPPVFVPG